MRSRQSIDYIIFAATGLLLIIGLAALASASSDLGELKFSDAYYYLKHQVFYGLSFGIIGFWIGRTLNYRVYKKIAPIFLLLSLAALILVFSPLGLTAGGAQRWIQLGPVTIQPSELLKLFFIGYLAAWLSSTKRERQKSIGEGFLPFIIISGIIAALLLAQNSTSAAIILMVASLAIYFISGARKKYIVAIILLGIVAFGAVIMSTEYRRERVLNFLNPFFNPEAVSKESTYQLDQALITIGSGGFKGVGYGQSTSKNYLPERIGDSIFAIIAEEFGLIGSLAVISLFFTLVTRMFILAKRAGDQFGKLLLAGFATIIGFQTFIHIGANSGLIPLTGVSLPFISFGGTALAVFMTMIGITLNISKHVRR
ncbi:MAG: putative peptidoglycan glycosyltransferase FtsW [Candidatus Colwellbacteria bacterium]|nr:putative peptidoglycan glycosyltransferase FtsW [Candidatus Colwellbacteria bacterium]